MWIGIVLGVIALLIIGIWIYTTVNTKNVVEYYPNGKIKLKGVTKFNERVGSFDHFDENGELSTVMYYEKGILLKESIILPYKYTNSKAILSELINRDALVLRFFTKELKNDFDIVMRAVKSSGEALEYASDELKNDREIVLEAVKSIKRDTPKNGSVLKFASSELKNNKEIVLTAIQSNINQFHDASENLKRDIIFLKSIFETRNNLDKKDRGKLFGLIRDINEIKTVMTLKDYFVVSSTLLVFLITVFSFINFGFDEKSMNIWMYLLMTIISSGWVAYFVACFFIIIFNTIENLEFVEYKDANSKLEKWLNSENE